MSDTAKDKWVSGTFQADPAAYQAPGGGPAITTDPQATTPTAIGYMGASAVSRKSGGVNLAGQVGPNGYTAGLGGNAGLLKPDAKINLEAVATLNAGMDTSGAVSGPAGSVGLHGSGQVGQRLTLGAYANVTAVAGQLPADASGPNLGGAVTGVAEVQLGGTHDQPRAVLGVNGTVGGQRALDVQTQNGKATINGALTGGATLNLAVNPAFYEGTTTPKATVFVEAGVSGDRGTAAGTGASASTVNLNAAVGVAANKRLGDGKAILTGTLAAGLTQQTNTIGGDKDTKTGGQITAGVGITF